MSEQNSLVTLLERYQIPHTQWGTGKAKTIGHLEHEVAEGEAALVEEGGKLNRVIAILAITVIGPQGQLLVEDRQVFNDGRERRRSLPQTLSEKLKAGEMPTHAAVCRALSEELFGEVEIDLPEKAVSSMDETATEGESPSFPGLNTRTRVFNYRVQLSENFYVATGYVEVQKDKSTFFVWA